MRENMGIYRGKALKWNRWVEGYFLKHYNDYGIVAIGSDGKDQAWVSVDTATVGQFTGLVDKNGAKVFEGDIVEFSDGIFRRMEWCQDKLGFTARCGNPDLTMESLDISGDKSAEVVGNIHDNRLLMEATL